MVRRKEVADSRLSPGSKCRAGETAPGIATVTRAAWGKYSAGAITRRGGHPQGCPPHRLVLPLLYPASEEAAAGAGDSRRQ